MISGDISIRSWGMPVSLVSAIRALAGQGDHPARNLQAVRA
jgi:hypothetical protein